ncbi:MAG: ACT domain-containing protein [Sarcina sp.]|nr:ACT domain-containing protein [Sarcina sp.]MBE6002152.1 ACT domain-containing protein [Sarcina sp.]
MIDDLTGAVLEPLKTAFSVCKVRDYAGVEIDQPFVFIGRTDEEKSLVCPTDRVPADTLAREDGWRAFRICGELDFSLIGILSRISTILAENKIGIFAVSTYNTDYILTKSENFERALKVLGEAGYRIKKEPGTSEETGVPYRKL